MEYYIIVVIVVLILLALFVRWSNIQLKKRFKRLASALGGYFLASFFGWPSVEGRCQEVPFRILFRRGSKHSPNLILVQILTSPGFVLSLREEDLGTKISKKFSLAKETKTGVTDFDERFFIQTNDEFRCQSFLSNQECRDLITGIYDKGWVLQFTKNRIELFKPLDSKIPPEIKSLDDLKQVFRPIWVVSDEEIEELLGEATLLSKNT